jgi:RNA polymerase sigma factor (sigma-70 family)
MSDAVLETFSDVHSAERLRRQLLQLARSRYGISADAAEDVVQNALTSYLEVRHRYDASSNSQAILFGIFFKKCLEHIDRTCREKRRLHRYCATPDAARQNPWIRPDAPAETPGVLSQLIRNEEGCRIQAAIERLRPASRSLVQMIVTRGLGRQALIQDLGINRNTLDSRLHACRRELRGLLAHDGVAI